MQRILFEPLNQPAKLAERVLAPGDGEAEPGDPTKNQPSPRSGRQIVRPTNIASRIQSHFHSEALRILPRKTFSDDASPDP